MQRSRNAHAYTCAHHSRRPVSGTAFVKMSIDRLRNKARNTIVNTADQWQRHPRRSGEYGPHQKNLKYDEARDWVLRMVSPNPPMRRGGAVQTGDVVSGNMLART